MELKNKIITLNETELNEFIAQCDSYNTSLTNKAKKPAPSLLEFAKSKATSSKRSDEISITHVDISAALIALAKPRTEGWLWWKHEVVPKINLACADLSHAILPGNMPENIKLDLAKNLHNEQSIKMLGEPQNAQELDVELEKDGSYTITRNEEKEEKVNCPTDIECVAGKLESAKDNGAIKAGKKIFTYVVEYAKSYFSANKGKKNDNENGIFFTVTQEHYNAWIQKLSDKNSVSLKKFLIENANMPTDKVPVITEKIVLNPSFPVPSCFDFSECYITGQEGRYVKLAALSRAKLNFNGACLEKVEFTGGTFHKASFIKAELKDIECSQADFRGSVFIDTRVENLNARFANFSKINARDAEFSNVKFAKTKTSAAIFEGATFDERCEGDIIAYKTNFSEAKFKKNESLRFCVQAFYFYRYYIRCHKSKQYHD